MSRNKREEKRSTGYTVKAESESGVLKAYVSIFGIEDDSWMNDIIEPGAFKKTIAERGPSGSNKIRVLWMHTTREVIGKPILLEEHSRDLLPDSVRERYPLASGGLYAETQLVLDVQRGREAFALYRDGAMDEWSIGFDPIDQKFEDVDNRTIRRLREVRLWEYSPVTWGANPATTTVEVKHGMIELLDEIKQEYPDFSDYQLICEVKKRLSPSEIELQLSEEQREICTLMQEIKCEHPDFDKLNLILAVEKRLSPEPKVIEPEPVVAIEEEKQSETTASPLVNLDNWKWVASRRNELLKLELLMRGRNESLQS